ncbi:TetR/AcrR family transcriptional regulator [Caldimonas thermodepolymerans]|jgi:AcrR family transcriptional regulator|uniref:TetR family transcriptional regulator n=1 Tax=Caldimonas thermodepolymerans TaxID=215580 RepID=A0AA46DFC2_9BURK|nr:TetR/AcrR family transcriptional regulator [Caldimonas thermodepolymerans]QPC30431.1 TetR/AcrR family transcriptional regulator [Caldimonas thermodepolymerans]RDI02990.1 TetR family transcriptional regulator [Caldimonas thermodepolymerans]TCP08534.1 TetR family transcriptional regulator [Caldimonas thermodepolymerans]UZG43198.1 TetR/AcrR family transcriptional regulator [Caldimonas thermodepolymerans]UZG46864.1 TetR/AcrR family transcriptional regulator [Caldimonas thermodepolymerans]
MLSTSPAPAPAEPGPSRRRRKEARPQELLDAALDLFVEKGFAATKMDDVAARAGVSKGTVYLYFPSKEELLKAVIRHNLTLTISQVDDLVDQFEGSTADLMRLAAATWWEQVGATQASGIFKLIITEVRNFPDLAAFYAQEVIEPGERLLVRLLQRGVDRGEFRTTPNPLDTAHSLIFPLLMLCLHKHSIGACPSADAIVHDPRRFIDNHLDLMLQGLLARTA